MANLDQVTQRVAQIVPRIYARRKVITSFFMGTTEVDLARASGPLSVSGLSTDGNAGSATKLATPRTIQLSGGATGSANFDGSANINISVTLQGLSTVAVSGSYGDLSGTPALAAVATSGAYSDLSGAPALAAVATSGSFDDLSDKPGLRTIGQQVVTTPTTLNATHAGAHLLLGTGASIEFPASGYASGEGVLLSNVSGGAVVLSAPGGADFSSSLPNGGSFIALCDGGGFWRQYCYSNTRL